MDAERALAVVDRFLPREVLGPVLIVFAAENVISALFSAFVPPSYAAIGWAVIFVISAIFISYWTSEDDDENFEG